MIHDRADGRELNECKAGDWFYEKYLLRNRVRNSILLAILLQSIVFGIGLAVSGTFTGTTSRPYKVMESQAADKNSLISNYMNNALLLANTMEKEMGRLSEVGEIHDRLIDNLNHISAADGVFIWTWI